jgi:hypothetical protein
LTNKTSCNSLIRGKEGAMFLSLVRATELHRRPCSFHYRTISDPHGLTKAGTPGANEGLSDKDPTVAQVLKAQGYATGRFGKNRLGDRKLAPKD